MQGVDVGVTLYPSLERFYADFNRFNDVIRELAASERVPLVDLDRDLPDDRSFFIDIVHHSTGGMRAVARVLDSAATRFLPPGTSASLKSEYRLSCNGVF
jgi:hypothetical protein